MGIRGIRVSGDRVALKKDDKTCGDVHVLVWLSRVSVDRGGTLPVLAAVRGDARAHSRTGSSACWSSPIRRWDRLGH